MTPTLGPLRPHVSSNGPHRLLTHRRCAHAQAFALILALSCAPAFGQSTSPWAFDASRERVSVEIGGTPGVWTTDRAQVSWTQPDVGGWFALVERQQRGQRVDVTPSFRAYKRATDWTVAAGVGATPSPDFQYRYSVDGELSRRVVATLVASAGYRFLAYRGLHLHQVQPALTWYHARGEVQGRLFVTRNQAANRTSPTGQLRALIDVHRRLRLGGGVAYGDRIFDVSLLPSGSARSSVGFVTARIGITTHDAIELGGAVAEEAPAFTYRALSLGYRRTF